VIGGVRPNREYEITAATAAARADTGVTDAGEPAALFEDASDQLAGHTHVEPMFDDWARQFLLPNSLSQLGPGVSWVDLDADGDEDLLIGSGRGGRLGVFRNEHGRLVRKPAEGPVAPADLTTILGFPAKDGPELLLGVSSWEGQEVSAVMRVRTSSGVVGPTAEPFVEGQSAATGPLALADYDGDGDLDLFVGGRAIPGRYPEAASSMLLRNERGRLVLDTANTALLHDVGLVSSAIFADINGDGHPDLMLAREWDSLLLLLNDGHGKFSVAPASWGLARWTSRWNGIAAGDLNGDGRLDLVATSWGRNTIAPADSASPLLLVYGPIGSMGEEEMLLAREDPRLRAPTLLNGYPRVRVALPDLPSRVSTFAAYADASVDQVLGPHRSQVNRKQVMTLDHMMFLNRGDHFEAVPLPAEAQFAPAFYAGIADFDGDGDEDVFLSQNFSATAVGIPRYDAGRGLLLRGDGKGHLEPLPGSRSGILVYGDQRGAAYADFDGDGRVDLAISQNGAGTRLLRNRGAKPGLRVHVKGPASNPAAVGAQVRLIYGDRMGPVREIQAGSGYWSENGAVQVFGIASPVTGVWVRWPGGSESRVAVPRGTKDVIVSWKAGPAA